MRCAYPNLINSILRPCGQCQNCRINKQREWTGRILLEAQMYPISSFVTLTYADEHETRIPHPEAKNLTLSNLVPKDLSGFLNPVPGSWCLPLLCRWRVRRGLWTSSLAPNTLRR